MNSNNSPDPQKVQRDQEEIFRTIVERSKAFLEEAIKAATKSQSAVTPARNLSFFINGKKFTSLEDIKYNENPSLSPKDTERILNTIKSSATRANELKIKVGRDTVFHIRHGEVITDKLKIQDELKLNSSVSQSENMNRENLDSKDNISQSIETKIDNLTAKLNRQQVQIDGLNSKIDLQQQKINALEGKLLRKIDFITRSSFQIKNPKLNSWMGNIGQRIANSWQEIKDKVQNFINDRVQNATEKVANVSAKFLEKPVNFVLNKYGIESTPGQLSFEGQKFTFSKDMDSGTISIRSNQTQEEIVAGNEFTAKASPEDIKILKDLPEKTNRIQQQQTTKAKQKLTR